MSMEDTNDIVDTQSDADTRAESENESESVVAPRSLGLARWVQYVFVVVAAFLFWLLDKVVMIVWATMAEPNGTVSSIGAGIVAAVVALRFFRHEPSHRVATEIVAELAKVSWPSRKETYASTIVVIITSLIMAVIVGSFDFVWSAITDLLYKYKV